MTPEQRRDAWQKRRAEHTIFALILKPDGAQVRVIGIEHSVEFDTTATAGNRLRLGDTLNIVHTLKAPADLTL